MLIGCINTICPRNDIVNASYLVAFLDTFIAIMAGVAIFTVVFSSGYDPTAGPGLVFHVLPPLLSQFQAYQL